MLYHLLLYIEQPGKGWENTDKCWSSYWNDGADAWVAYVNTGPRGSSRSSGSTRSIQLLVLMVPRVLPVKTDKMVLMVEPSLMHLLMVKLTVEKITPGKLLQVTLRKLLMSRSSLWSSRIRYFLGACYCSRNICSYRTIKT